MASTASVISSPAAGVKGYEVLKDADIESFGRKVGEKAVRLLNANTPPSGKFPIITDNELTGYLYMKLWGMLLNLILFFKMIQFLRIN